MNRSINRTVVVIACLAFVTVIGCSCAAIADDAETAETTHIRIDTAKVGHPINPFIYGQFIEHLGRCIYGGIRAEMLEDRKFYHPITPDYSPYGPGKDMANDPPLPFPHRNRST